MLTRRVLLELSNKGVREVVQGLKGQRSCRTTSGSELGKLGERDWSEIGRATKDINPGTHPQQFLGSNQGGNIGTSLTNHGPRPELLCREQLRSSVLHLSVAQSCLAHPGAPLLPVLRFVRLDVPRVAVTKD